MTSKDIMPTGKCNVYGLLYDGEQWADIIEVMFEHDDTEQYARMMLDDLTEAIKTAVVPFISSGAQKTCATCKNYHACRIHLTAPSCKNWKGAGRYARL